ncbi:MAG: DNA-directed RNA polymerase sigma-70 factor [Isosphaeraceae bacterium]|nr:MAG: DNA-directed RNA polymerase sigma-70 factor [Isosphaeraceae bacterium]
MSRHPTTRSTTPIDPGDDAALALALQSGRPDAVRLLLDRYEALLLGICSRLLGHRQDAEDVVQETFLRALRAIGRFDLRRPLRPWLIRIAVNRCRSWRARSARHAAPIGLLDDHADGRSGLHDPDDLLGTLQAALNQLRPEYQTVFRLFHERGLPYDQIALSLGRPAGTIKTWLHRARAELAAQLARNGHLESPPSVSGDAP